MIGVSGSDESYDISPPPGAVFERTESQTIRWVLITGNRLAVSTVMLGVVFVVFLGLSIYGPHGLRQFLSGTLVSSLFGVLLFAVTTAATLVFTLSQFVLSQQLVHLHNFRDRMDHTMAFRTNIEDHLDITVSPAQPISFFQALVEGVEDDLQELRSTVADGDDSSAAVEVNEFIDTVYEDTEQERQQVEDADLTTFGGILPVLNHNYGWQIHLGRQLRNAHAEELSDETVAQFDDLIRTIQFFGPAREYFKTLYFQQELVAVSRSVLYSTLPTLGLAGYMAVLFDPTAVSGWLFGISRVFGVNTAVLFVSVAFVLTLVPFVLLLAHLLRAVTVINRTLTIGPFALRESQLPEIE